jgi:hypothetical protein
MLHIILYVILLFTFACFTHANIFSQADRCAMILQVPGSSDTFDMLDAELTQNCFRYFNVRIDRNTSNLIKEKYESVINASLKYEDSYSANERLLYKIQSWVNMVISDPLSSSQQQLKECNAQLLVNTFNLDDMQNTLPIFVMGQQYMKECFEDAVFRITKAKAQIDHECIVQQLEATAATQLLRDNYNALLIRQHEFKNLQPVLRQNIIDMYDEDILLLND